ncbi:MAG: sulfatase-like hydrolase/transferase [Candidatus Hydrogenedentes bacterium]|jgi:arylsulfatase A-like enzyme|nr:sulfatase-like hydrolase/transferase [Candidatus Hydrogenedentota bacterium]
MKKRYLVYLIKFGVVVGLFVLIFKPEWFGMSGLFGNVAPLDIWNKLRDVSSSGPKVFLFWMACATLVKLLGITSGIIRWRLLLRGQGLHIPFTYLAYQWFMGRAIGLVLPGTLGLDGYRLVESSRYTRDVVKCTTVIAVEKLTGIIALSFLVFTTFPLGLKYLQFNMVLLLGIMGCLLVGVICSLLLLLNPRVIQVLAAVMPVPEFARGPINKLGRAATAYSRAKGTLLAALFFGILVHLGTCSKYFFTFMAIRATNVSPADIFFVSPLMITAGILTFTISGLGVREMAFGLVLGSATGHAVAILGGHLGLWAGEIIPFALSVPLLLFGGRPSRAALEEDRAYVEENLAKDMGELHPLLNHEETLIYRKKVFTVLFSGILSGLFVGMLIACLESFWIGTRLSDLHEWGMLPWGVAAYSIIFSGIGLALSAGILFVSLLLDRFPSWPAGTALLSGLVFFAGACIIGVFRYQRDLLGGHGMTQRDYMMIACLAGGLSLVLVIIAFLKAASFRRFISEKFVFYFGAGIALWLILTAAAWGLSKQLYTETPSPVSTVEAKSTGPNVILLAVDALRADYLSIFNPNAEAKTPHLQDFAKDAVVFQHTYSQAPWTKPSFATLFTGLYPEAHGATSKTASLSPAAETVAELFQQGGYYTQGFSNNPNTTSLFGMNRGFSNYVELKPDLFLKAPASASNLSLYGVLRKVIMVLEGKIRRGYLRVTDFYQPADRVTESVFSWLDYRESIEDRPFYLYLHYMETHDPFMDHNRPGIGYARARMEHPDPKQYLELMRNAYVSEIEFLDHHLGDLFEGLKERNLYDNTIIAFVSDHGEEFYDHQGWWHGQTLYEELLHVPLILKLPDSTSAGEENTSLTRLIDVPPTLLTLAGLEPGAAMSGQSLYDSNGVLQENPNAYSYASNDFEGNVLQGLRSLHTAVMKANEDNPREIKTTEFYNMVDDPAQQNDLSALPEHAEELQQFKDLLEKYIQAIYENAPEPGLEVEMDPQIQQQLEALGYL